jgi:ribokinase
VKVLNLGSLNIDHVYRLPRFPRPGETLASGGYERFAGGKGFNQSVALANAGAQVVHAGKIGEDGAWLREALRSYGVDTGFVERSETPTGHALIEVLPDGENAIVLFPGANQTIGAEDITRYITLASSNDILLTQNETSGVGEMIREAQRRKMRIVFNPAPLDDRVHGYPLDAVTHAVLNETEAQALVGAAKPDAAMKKLKVVFPNAAIVLTLGEDGVKYADRENEISVPAVKVDAVDSTAAGDTFIGFFIAGLIRNDPVQRCLRSACKAAALCVTRRGAAQSIPKGVEVYS